MAAFLYTSTMARTAHFHLLVRRHIHTDAVYVGACIALVVYSVAAAYSLPMQLPLMLLAVMLLGYWFLVRGFALVRAVVLAMFFALFITTHHTYVYEHFNAYISGVHVYPLLLWTVSLVTLKQLYDVLPPKDRLIAASVLYLLLLFLLEAVGYYLLDIRTAGGYPSLMGTGIIHGPPIIHVFYVSAGPLYLWVIGHLRW
jgi:hypothetical protein